MFIFNKKTYLLVALLIVSISAPFYVSALELDYPAVPTPIGPLDLNEVTSGGGFTVAGLVMFLYGLAVWIGGILAFVSLVYVGFIYILSGSGMVGRGKALRRLKEVLWGLVILLFAGVILNTINPDILQIEDPSVVFVAPGSNEFQGFTFEHITETGFGGGGEFGGGDSGGGGSSWEGVDCGGGGEAPPPDPGSTQALCSTGAECETWCYEPEGSGNKGPAEALRSDPQYAENWPAIYPSSCTVSMEEVRGQWGGDSGWVRVDAVNGDIAGWSPFISGLEKAGQEALSQGFKLALVSGYRPLYDQVRVLCWNGGRNADPGAMDGVIGSTVARPGKSNHGVGVAVDVELRTSGGSFMSRNCAYAIQLKKIIFDSDPNWYRLSNEYWHFEYWPDGAPSSSRIRDYGTCAGF